MNYEFELTEDNLKESLKKDILKRNTKINNLLRLINSLTRNTIITIDGAWGTGKTVFVKQIETINKCDFNENGKEIVLRNIDKLVKETFNSNHIVYYYNAWENDNHNDPLLSIIYKLINDFPKFKNITTDLKSNKIPINLKEFLKTWSQGLIQATEVQTLEELVNDIYTVDEQKQAFNNLLNSIIPNGKKMVIIIDELDRCNPKFAIDIIETIKHFYDNNNIIFILSSNNEQLAHTVSKFYGNNFDGYGYLNKIYNFIVSLEKVNPVSYVTLAFEENLGSTYFDTIALAIFEYYDFSMREIGRYMYYMKTLSSYYHSSDGFRENTFVKCVFLPYCLGLKLKNIKKYNDFINGNGINDFILFLNNNVNCQQISNDIYEREVKEEKRNEMQLNDYVKDIYNKYFTNVNSGNYNIQIVRTNFLDVLSLISNWSEI